MNSRHCLVFQLAVAEKEREIAATQLRARLDQQFKEIKAIYQVKVEQDFDIFVKEVRRIKHHPPQTMAFRPNVYVNVVLQAVPPAVQRVVEVEDDVKHYVNSIVPAAVEKQSGEVSTHVESLYYFLHVHIVYCVVA